MGIRTVSLIFGMAMALRAANAKFSGDATYYGENGWAGSCMGNMRWANGVYDTNAWPPSGGQFGTRVALNSRQYSTAMCGKKLMFRGTGVGLGGSPISTQWQKGMVTNLCPECQYGDLDMGIGGDGRWKIEWYWLDDASSKPSTVYVGSAKRGLSKKTKKVSRKKHWVHKSRSKKVGTSGPGHWARVWNRVKGLNSRKGRAQLKRMLRKYHNKHSRRGLKLR